MPAQRFEQLRTYCETQGCCFGELPRPSLHRRVPWNVAPGFLIYEASAKKEVIVLSKTCERVRHRRTLRRNARKRRT